MRRRARVAPFDGFVLVDVKVGVVQATDAAWAWLAEVGSEDLVAFVRDHVDGNDEGLASGGFAGRVSGSAVFCEQLLGHGPNFCVVQLTLGQGITATLTARQREVAELAARGATAREVAEHLGIAFHTVKQHLAAVYERLEVGSRVELVEALRRGDEGAGS